MRKSIIVSLLAFISWLNCQGCAWMSTHNYYLFCAIEHDKYSAPHYDEQVDDFWSDYTNGQVEHFDADAVYAVAKSKNDTYMMHYLEALMHYLSIGNPYDGWDYPTKEQIRERNNSLEALLKTARAYKGSQLAAQWTLMEMRVNMQLNHQKDNLTLWETKASKLPDSFHKEMMRNLYAGALTRTGRMAEAADIYAEQSDKNSIHWLVRKYENMEGIRAFYAQSPNNDALTYLVQLFVNDFQESRDSEYDEEWVKMVDSKIIPDKQGQEFISFAEQVMKDGQCENPCLWESAIGALLYHQGHYDEAYRRLDHACQLAGTTRMKENARIIRLLAMTRMSNKAKDYEQTLRDEVKWLTERARKEHQNSDLYETHFSRMLDRLVHLNLLPQYEKKNQPWMAAATLAMYQDVNDRILGIVRTPPTPADKDAWNPDYSTWLFVHLDTLRADDVVRYKKWLSEEHPSVWEQYLAQHNNVKSEFLDDLIGTKLMAEGRFEEAADYLQRVPLHFMESLNVSYYLGNRDYKKERWFYRERKKYELDGAFKSQLAVNPKLQFCQEVIDLQRTAAKSSDKEKRYAAAYQLATMLYQACCYGDCWCLTHYGNSSADTPEPREKDFVEMARQYLEQSVKSQDADMQWKSQYALAFLPTDEYKSSEWDETTSKYVTLIHKNSLSYRYLNRLNEMRREMPFTPAYVTKCVVLKDFVKDVN